MWDPRFLTRDWTCVPCIGRQIPNHWTIREVPQSVFSIPGLERYPGGGHGNPLQYSCLENPHGQRSLVGYSPSGLKESNMTERLSTAQHIRWFGFMLRFVTLCSRLTPPVFKGGPQSLGRSPWHLLSCGHLLCSLQHICSLLVFFFFFNVFRIINKLITGYYITMATWQLARKKQVAQLPWGLRGTKVIVDFFSASLCLASLFFSPLFLLLSSLFGPYSSLISLGATCVLIVLDFPRAAKSNLSFETNNSTMKWADVNRAILQLFLYTHQNAVSKCSWID